MNYLQQLHALKRRQKVLRHMADDIHADDLPPVLSERQKVKADLKKVARKVYDRKMRKRLAEIRREANP